MSQAQGLVRSLNMLAKSPQFDYRQARATARKDENVDWAQTKALNDDFNPEVDGCESFAMKDGSRCTWLPTNRSYAAR